MWLFEAKYINMDSGEKVIRKIAFDGENFCDTEDQCYICAMKMALKNRNKNERLYTLDFISC